MMCKMFQLEVRNFHTFTCELVEMLHPQTGNLLWYAITGMVIYTLLINPIDSYLQIYSFWSSLVGGCAEFDPFDP